MADGEVLVLEARCPVCGEGFADEPTRACERCETPHHPECWEYVPGCAVFGCADDGTRALPTADWPEIHALVLRGMRWITAATTALQAVPVTFAVAFLAVLAGIPPHPLMFLPFVLASGATVYAMNKAFEVKHEVHARGLGGFLASAGADGGDRRLARAVAERTGRTVPLPPSVLAALLAGAVALPIVLTGRWDQAAVNLSAFLALVFYGALKLPARWVGYQRILANRLGAAVEASLPVKELPEK